MVLIAPAPISLHSAVTCTRRLFSSTTKPGQTTSSNSLTLTVRSRRSISASSTSNARAPTVAAAPPMSSRRSAAFTSNRSKRNTGAATVFSPRP
jgi:hypothetical protein